MKAFGKSLTVAIATFLNIGVNSTPTGVQEAVPAAVGLFGGPYIILSLNEIAGRSFTNQILGRELELIWCNVGAQTGDWVGLFTSNPKTFPPNSNIRQQAIRSYTGSSIFGCGYIKTDIRLPPMIYTSSATDFGEDCQRYWVSYYRQNTTLGAVVSNCIRMYPRWMTKRAAIIGNKPLTSLMLPGTHDSGSWSLYDPYTDNVATKYIITQEESFYNQMVSGIRVFDIRPAYYPDDPDKFWINHADFKVTRLIDMLRDVKRFVTETNEIVILDFHEFPVGFTSSSIHSLLYTFVTNEIGSYLAPRMDPKTTTLNKLWSIQKPIVWSYNNAGFYPTKADLWKPIIQAWGNTNNVTVLRQYLSTAVATYGCSGTWWSAMAELTASPWDVIFKPDYGLRRMAAAVNKPLNLWYTNSSWYSRSNIVSTDFFKGNDMIELCITVNEKNGGVC